MIGDRDSVDDLLIAARRGALSEVEQRGLREALASSLETALLYEAGCALDGEAPVLPGDEALIERMVRRVEKQQARRTVIRPARYVAYGVALGLLIAGLAAGAIELLRPHAGALPAPAAAPPTLTPSHAAQSVPTPLPTVLPVPAAVPVLSAVPPSPAAPHLAAPHPADETPPAPVSPSPTPPSTDPPTAQFGALPAPVASTAPALFAAANQARVNGDTSTAISTYQQLESAFPSSNEALTAHLSLGVLYLQHGQAALALREFRLSRAQGGDAAQAEALWGEAQALRKLGRVADERAALDELLQNYPRSAYSAAAQKRRADLD